MPALETLVPLVRMHVRNCPDPIIEDAILRVAREFCAETRFLRETLVLDIVGEQRIYDLAAELDDCEVIGVHAVQISDEEPLTPLSFEDDQPTTGATAENWSFTPPARLWLNPTPDNDLEDGMAVRVILQPASDATTLPNELLRHNDRAIADGAIAWLCSMEDAAWGSPSMVALFSPQFASAKARAQLNSDNQFKPRAIRTTAYR